MSRLQRMGKTGIALILLALLIFKTDTAVTGAWDGVQLCIRVIIPTLFPFFVVTTYLNQLLLGTTIPGLQAICRILHIPKGGDSLLLLGLIGGYPVGAQLINTVYTQKQISKRTAKILLGYCNNAGPAFIFGTAAVLFSRKEIPFIIWLIQIVSAIIVGSLLPKPQPEEVRIQQVQGFGAAELIQNSMRICASVCGWVILFKIIIAFASYAVPQNLLTYISGILELSNGCQSLSNLTAEADRFILFCVFLSFGGICVMLQTASAVPAVGKGLYVPGKLMQTIISYFLSTILSPLLFPGVQTHWATKTYIFPGSFLILILICAVCKKRYGNLCENAL